MVEFEEVYDPEWVKEWDARFRTFVLEEESNEVGERLWYPTRIWNNQEDR